MTCVLLQRLLIYYDIIDKHTANISSIPPASDLVRTHLCSYATQVKWICGYIFAIIPIGGGGFRESLAKKDPFREFFFAN